MDDKLSREVATHIPDVIQAAAASNLGIVALMAILFSVLAYSFFRHSSEIWRFTSLGLFFVGCVLFGYVVLVHGEVR